MPYIGNIVQDFSVNTAMLNSDSVTSIKIDDGTIVNADINDSAAIAMSKLALSITNSEVNASAAIAGSKIDPSFTSNLTVTNTAPALVLVDSDHNSDFNIQASGGVLAFNDSTNSATRISIASDGTVDVNGNLDCNSGLDVTGNITATGNISSNNITISSSGPRLTFTDSNEDPDFYIEVNATQFLIQDATNNAQRFRIQNNGVVDIPGNTNFSAGIDVVGNITGTQDIVLSSGGSERLNMTHAGGGQFVIKNPSAAALSFGTNNQNNELFIANGGNVGIGITNPSQTLDVNGNGLIQGTLQVNDRVQLVDSTPELLLSVPSGGLDSRILNDGSGNLIVGHGVNSDTPTERLRMDSDGNITATKSIVSENLPGRNILINGDCRIAQRGTSGTFTNAGTSYPSLDRLKISRNGVTGTFAQVGDAPAGKGFHFSGKLTTTSAVNSIAAGNALQISIPVERNDVICLGYGDASAKTSVLSFYVKSSLTGSFGVGFTRNSRVQSHNITYSSADTWQFVEVVIPGDTSTAINGGMTDIGMNINITISAGTNTVAGGAATTWINFHNSYVGGGATMQHLTNNGSTFQVTGLQYEIGSKATPFEHRSISEEFARCHRYFFKNINESGELGANYAKAFNSTELFTSQRFPVRMRATPTVITYSNSGTAGQVHKLGSPDVSYTSIDRLDVYGGMRFNGNSGTWATGDTDMYSYTLEASAEL